MGIYSATFRYLAFLLVLFAQRWALQPIRLAEVKYVQTLGDIDNNSYLANRLIIRH